ncbi:MAG TPA: HAMP domain-containing sensor histidine kinase [Candidatus Limnocylindrales bacterium]|nr:HAMP domain-containing sensor histidine kinase [Candidatus Limnocylindrales bacterium]
MLRLAWVAGACLCAIAMYLMPRQETVPFHLIWLGLFLLFGLTPWRPLEMLVMAISTAAVTGAIEIHHAAQGWIEWSQTAEVPASVALAAVIATYLRRRHVALMELARVAEAERRRAEQRQFLVRKASHELRTPITIARGYTELIAKHLIDKQDIKDATMVLEELDRLSEITQRLLTLMQIDGDFRRRPLPLATELERIVRRWIPAADRRWRVACDDGEILANRERLEATLDCLLDNAVKFTEPGDLIEVSGDHDDRAWVIKVCDTGRGMSTRDAAALTAAQPLSHSSGTGLGLATVRTVIGAWGGTMRIQAKPDTGTTVILRLPHTMVDDSQVISVETGDSPDLRSPRR